MTTLYCAECERRFEPDDDHTRVTLERRSVDERNQERTYVLCPECTIELAADWVNPA